MCSTTKIVGIKGARLRPETAKKRAMRIFDGDYFYRNATTREFFIEELTFEKISAIYSAWFEIVADKRFGDFRDAVNTSTYPYQQWWAIGQIARAIEQAY